MWGFILHLHCFLKNKIKKNLNITEITFVVHHFYLFIIPGIQIVKLKVEVNERNVSVNVCIFC